MKISLMNKKNIRLFLDMEYRIIVFMILVLFSYTIRAGTETYNKQWTTDVIIGSLSKDEKIKYYLEPQLRLIDNSYVFNQAFFMPGLGYQFSPSVLGFIGPGLVFTKNTAGETYYEYRLWQQLNWQAVNMPSIRVDSRTRWEERERSNESQVSLRFRERLWMHIPIAYSQQYYFSTFDEVFFNMNQPSWVAPRFFDENRAFIGIGKQLTQSTFLDVGYLNQLEFGPPREMNNVLLLSFSTMI
jgi:hypothetical protein